MGPYEVEKSDRCNICQAHTDDQRPKQRRLGCLHDGRGRQSKDGCDSANYSIRKSSGRSSGIDREEFLAPNLVERFAMQDVTAGIYEITNGEDQPGRAAEGGDGQGSYS